MFIILIRGDWFRLEIVPLQFSCESEAIDYAKEKVLPTFQVIEVSI